MPILEAGDDLGLLPGEVLFRLHPLLLNRAGPEAPADGAGLPLEIEKAEHEVCSAFLYFLIPIK